MIHTIRVWWTNTSPGNYITRTKDANIEGAYYIIWTGHENKKNKHLRARTYDPSSHTCLPVLQPAFQRSPCWFTKVYMYILFLWFYFPFLLLLVLAFLRPFLHKILDYDDGFFALLMRVLETQFAYNTFLSFSYLTFSDIFSCCVHKIMFHGNIHLFLVGKICYYK